jgi:hypothetical protein
LVSLTVLCEGPTEVNFVTQVLKPHLSSVDVFAKPTSLGGGLTWEKVKTELNLALRQRRDHEWATTMFDLYKMMRVPDCPNLGTSHGRAKAIKLEAAMAHGLPSPNFVPYVQVHEFEALVYVDLTKLADAFPDGEATEAIPALQNETQGLQPEDINEQEETAPSKRLIREIAAYKSRKTTAGPQVAEHIGLPTLRAACPHFNDWVSKLEVLSR